jgi:UPF0042 nucleotide-binding protein
MTGMSGAGKSQAVNALEDMGYYCVDNVPPSLLIKFAELPRQSKGKISKIALVVDVRSRGMFSDYLTCLDDLRRSNYYFKTLFLDCDPSVLMTRYKETRRRHPLLSETILSVGDAVAAEQDMMAAAKDIADYIIDTSMLSAAQLKVRVRELFEDASSNNMVVTAMSFGFKFGVPSDSDLVFDVRCLPNPYYVQELREHTGDEKDVKEYVLGFEPAQQLAARLEDLLDFLIPLYIQEGKSQLVVSFGCTGGKHRSVVFAEHMARHLSDKGVPVNVSHRDIKRPI